MSRARYTVLAIAAVLVVLAAHARADEPLKLVQVQVLTRHGDRTPTNEIPISPVVWTCYANSLSVPAADVVSAVPAPSRLHALRYMPGMEVLEGNCSAGQLTDIGQQQQAALGEAIAERYIDELAFLPAEFVPETMFIRTSETPRCVMSAQELLGGLYPPAEGMGKAEIVPFFTVDSAVDTMALNPHVCPALEEAVTLTLLTNHTFIEHILAYLAPVTPAIDAAFNTSDPLVALTYYDNMVCRQAHGLPLPPGITPVVFALLTDAYNQIGTALWSAGAFSMGPFFATVLYNMDLVVANGGQFDPRLMLFSGHDTTVGPTLSALGAYSGLWPPYAAHVFFELWQNQTDSNGWFVQTLYQGLPIVPLGCESSMCPLATFQARLSKSIPDDYETACALKVPRDERPGASVVRALVRRMLTVK